MITKHDIIEMAHKVVRRGNGIPDRRLMHPHRDWLIGIAGAGLLAVIGIAYNTYLFRYYTAIEENVMGAEPAAVEYKTGAVERVLEAYEPRRAAFDSFRAGLPDAPPAPASEAGSEAGALDAPVTAE